MGERAAAQAYEQECAWVIFKYDEDQRSFQLNEQNGVEALSFASQLTFRLGEERGLVGLVAARGRPLMVPEVRTDPRWIPFDTSLQSAYLTPLEHDGQVLGVLLLCTRNGGVLDNMHRALADALASERAKLWARPPVAESAESDAAPRIDLSVLSQRELDVVQALSRGLRLSDIARVLGISSHTARNHLKHVFRKLGVHSQVELLSWLGRTRV